jgi:uncharacterized alpha-E superfamily protein
MLSRVANGLYWMSRYVERAENTARLVDVNLQLMLNLRNLNDSTLADHWMPIVQSTGDEEHFARLYARPTGQNVAEFFVFQGANPNSIISAIGSARENARTVRDQITVELWEALNRLYLFLHSPAARQLWDDNPHDFFNEVRDGSLLLQGMADATVVRNEGWLFMQIGRFLERADKTSRMLDVHHASLAAPEAGTSLSQTDVLGWSAMLRSCSAWDAYKALHGAEVRPEFVAEFLMLSEDFPRSVRFCLQQVNAALRRISGVAEGRFSNDAEKLGGRLHAELQFSAAADIFKPDLHTYLDQLQARLNAIGEALFQTYIFQAFQAGEETAWRQQEEQQQQQIVRQAGRFPSMTGQA